ncbi:hypothetical protein C1H46_034616 [Malus baccata]|uniref:Uncharacterized protein n=1 Tax=Malus baccata TaxID=106549 RepID=A0A540L032_MALBA|nr:hypothetical protein C1H46_034616 [Malus baccata]
MNQIRLAFQIFGIRFPDVEPPPTTASQPFIAIATTSQAPAAAATTSQPHTIATPPPGDCDGDDYMF